MVIDPATSVDDLMRRWPAAIRVFLDDRMHCPGCPIACFHTVNDACREHDADPDSFLADLGAVADGRPRGPAGTQRD